MTFNDIFKNKFLQQITNIELVDIIIAMIFAIVIGVYIFYFYKKMYRGILFSKMFATALIGMTLISTFIILAVTSNVVLSLGMVGALSIVRFRSSIKEPLDIVYIFWAISEGIVIGSRQYILALIGTIGISLALAIFSNFKEKYSRYILVLRYKNSKYDKLINLITKNTKKMIVKSNTVYKNREKEIIAEVVLKDNDVDLVKVLNNEKDVSMMSLVKYNGEYIIE